MKKRGTRIFNSEIDIKISPNSKRSQVTIFIIGAIVLIAIILLFFLFRSGVVPGIGGSSKETNEEAFLKSCMEDEFDKTVRRISMNGGYLNHADENKNKPYKTFQFGEEAPADIAYLCYTPNYYFSCVNQEPMLLEHLEGEIKKGIENKFHDCFRDLLNSLQDDGYIADITEGNPEIDIVPKKISIKADSKIKLTKNDETSEINGLNIIFSSRLYGIVKVVQEIVNKEAKTGGFEYLGYVLLYPEFRITIYDTPEGETEIYTVINKDTNEEFRFAVRGSVNPPGAG